MHERCPREPLFSQQTVNKQFYDKEKCIVSLLEVVETAQLLLTSNVT